MTDEAPTLSVHGAPTTPICSALLRSLEPLATPGIRRSSRGDAGRAGERASSAAFDPSTGDRRRPIVRVLAHHLGRGWTAGSTRSATAGHLRNRASGLDRPAWADLGRVSSPEWLLPGVGELDPQRCDRAWQRNPAFIDAYLAGLNTQLLSELHWRNIPVASGCTPIRRFWDRADTASGERRQRRDGGRLVAGHGRARRRLPPAKRRNRRANSSSPSGATCSCGYPATVVYLRSAVHAPSTGARLRSRPAGRRASGASRIRGPARRTTSSSSASPAWT